MSVAVVEGVVNGMRFRQHSVRLNCDPKAAERTDLSPLRRRQRSAAVVVAAGRSIEFGVMRSLPNHGLPHAAGVWGRRRNRQSRRGEDAHKQQYDEHSGGQAVHSGSGRPHTCFYRLTSRE